MSYIHVCFIRTMLSRVDAAPLRNAQQILGFLSWIFYWVLLEPWHHCRTESKMCLCNSKSFHLISTLCARILYTDIFLRIHWKILLSFYYLKTHSTFWIFCIILRILGERHSVDTKCSSSKFKMKMLIFRNFKIKYRKLWMTNRAKEFIVSFLGH